MEVPDEIYIQKCPGCEDHSTYGYLGKLKGLLVYRCPYCYMVKLLTLDEARKLEATE